MPKQSPWIVRPIVSVVASSVMYMYVKPKLRENFGFIEQALEGKEYFVGETLSGADGEDYLSILLSRIALPSWQLTNLMMGCP